MKLDIPETFNRRIITAYNYLDKEYFLLFYSNGVAGPFYVKDSAFALSKLLVYVGDVCRQSDDAMVGNIFYTKSPTLNDGSHLLAYSGLYKAGLNKRVTLTNDMPLVLKTPRLQVFNMKNKATLIVSPALKSDIKENLEI